MTSNDRRCVFFDRDGVLNAADVRDGKAYSPRSFAEFRLMGEAATVVREVKALGFLAIVVTNQPDIARGLMTQDELDLMLEHLRAEVPVDDIRHCPHDDRQGCDCRKPLPGMLIAAARDHRIDLAQSFIIGDSAKDMAAGLAAGCRTILLVREYNSDAGADYRIDSLDELPPLLRQLNQGVST